MNKKKKNNKYTKKSINTQKLASIEKSSVIVLAIAAMLFFVVFLRIYSEDLFNGANSIFWEYGDEKIDFDKATVTGILNEELEKDDLADGAYKGTQELAVTVKSGIYKGVKMTAFNYIGPLSGVPVSVGDSVILTIKTHSDGERSATVYEFNRIPILAIFILIFFIAVAIVGGRTGMKSLVGLLFTIFCLFTVLIPLLIKGAPTVLTTFLMCSYVALVCFTILGGIHRKTISAFLGTVSGTFLAMAFALVVQFFAKIDGLRLEDVEPMIQLKYAGAPITIHLQGLLAASIIISALGAVMDVAMSISSALEEVHSVNPKLSRNDLFRSGMNIGRDMVGTMTNTLILAFLGSEFTLIIFLYSRGLTFYHLFSTAFVALETISGISSSIGMVLAIPLTAFISSALLTNGKAPNRKH